jgi:uncharacterized protein YfkK (UPF0435 family)
MSYHELRCVVGKGDTAMNITNEIHEILTKLKLLEVGIMKKDSNKKKKTTTHNK